MRKLGVLASVMVFAAGAVVASPQAEARRGGWGAGILAGALIGGVIAASIASHRRHYTYYPRSYGYYYRPSYAYAAPFFFPTYSYRPVYRYRTYYAPVYRYRRVYTPVYRYRPVRFYRAGIYGGRYWRGGRRWR